jgi:hypothetical protein
MKPPVTKSYANLSLWGYLRQEGNVKDGYVATPDGVVLVMIWSGWIRGKATQGTMLTMTYAGRVYRRRHFKAYTERGVRTLARRFASEVVNI